MLKEIGTNEFIQTIHTVLLDMYLVNLPISIYRDKIKDK